MHLLDYISVGIQLVIEESDLCGLHNTLTEGTSLCLGNIFFFIIIFLAWQKSVSTVHIQHDLTFLLFLLCFIWDFCQ